MWNRCIASVNDDDPGFLPQYNQDSLRCLDLATYYQNLAEVRLAQADNGDPNPQEKIDDAIRFLEQSLDYSERYGAEPNKVASRLTGLAKAYFETGRTDDANHNLDAALQLATTLNDPYMLTAIHLLKGDVKLKLGKNENAEREYLNALSLAQENHFGEFEMEALSGAYECTKDSQPKRALAYFTQSAALKDSIYNKEQQALIRDFEVKYKMEETEYELALQQEKNRQGRRLLSLSVAVALLLLVLLIVGLRVAFLRKRRNEMKDQMLFVVAHDIKTPVVSQAQLLDMTCQHFDAMPKEEIKENIEALKMSTDDLKDKLQNIIYWVRNEMGGLSSDHTPFGISTVVDEVMQELSLQARMKGLSIANEVPAEWMAFDDEKAVRTVLQNLLSNAVKFSYPQGVVSITATEEAHCYRLTVTDHGRGIAKERMTLLLKGFAPYSQGTEGEVGTGIGLFVSQQLLSRNGGKITIESQEGQGTSVSFTIKKAQ
jgi:signal transduction histidine kinase